MTNKSTNWLNEKIKPDFFDPNTPHDRVILVEDKKFYVKSEYLSIQSEYFANLFNSESNEEKEMKIEDVKAEDFRVFLNACYPGSNDITPKNCYSIIDLAFRYKARGVLDQCRSCIKLGVLGRFNRLQLLECAVQYNLDDIKIIAMESIVKKDTLFPHYYCKSCNKDVPRDARCGNNHLNKMQLNGFQIDYYTNNDFIRYKEDQKRFLALPDDVQALLFRELLKANKDSP